MQTVEESPLLRRNPSHTLIPMPGRHSFPGTIPKCTETMKPLTITTGIPGGNAEILSVDESSASIRIRPELKLGSPHRGWFAFRMDGVQSGRLYTITVVENDWAGPYYFSCDGEKWFHFADYEQTSETDITFRQTFDADRVFVAMMPPYREEHLERLLDDIKDHPDVDISTLWTSEEGRDGTLIQITDDGGTANKRQLWFIARTHAFEAVASWVAEGLIRWALSDVPEAVALRGSAVISIVPVMDLDAVHAGSSGKYRPSVDFNRGWCDAPIWKAQKAVVNAMSKAPAVDVFLDLHGPGGNRRWTYFYTEHAEQAPAGYRDDMARFRELFEEATVGTPVPYEGIEELSPGPDNEEYASQAYRYILRRWKPRVSAVLETTWSADPAGIESFLATGRAVGLTCARFAGGE